jgi:hypothetical protein
MDSSSNGAYFANRRQPIEIIEGLITESQIVTLAGRIGMGKSPLLQNLTICLLTGQPFFGRKVSKRPVIVLDFETPDYTYKVNIERICKRLQVDLPHVPEELDVHLEREHGSMLRKKIALPVKGKFDWLRSLLKEKPTAAVIIDPIQIFGNLDTGKAAEILKVYGLLRDIMDEYPATFFLTTWNMRKGQANGKYTPPDLRTDAHGWLEGVSGSNSILSRSDVRLGLERIDDELRILNGIIRGQEITPILFRPAGDWPELAGFERVYDPVASPSLLAEGRRDSFKKLPHSFRYSDIADVPGTGIPHSTLTRLLNDCVRLGLITVDKEGVYVKR